MQRDTKYQHLLSTETLSGNLAKSSVRGAGFTAVVQVTDLALRLGSLAVLARLIAPEHFGLFAMVTAITLIAEWFKDLGLGVPTVQAKHISHAQVSNLFWVNAGVGLALATAVLVAGPVLVQFYKDARLAPIAWGLSASVLFGSLSVQHYALLRRQMRFGQIGTIQIAASLGSIIVAVWLAIAGYGYWALVWRDVCRSAFVTLGCWLACRWMPALPNREGDIRKMMSMGGDLTASNVLQFLTSSADQVLIGKFFGPVSLGYYRQAFQLGISTVSQMFYPITSVAEPALCSLQTEADRFRRCYLTVVETVSLISMPVAVFLVVYSRDVILFLLGEKWSGAVPFFTVFALAVFIRPTMATSAAVPIALGRTRLCLSLNVAHSVLLLTLFVVGSQWGMLGVAWAHVMTSTLMVLPVTYFSFRNSPVSIHSFFLAAARATTASVIMGLVLWTIGSWSVGTPLVRLLIGGVIGPVAYLGCWLLLPGGYEKLKQLLSVVLEQLQPRFLQSWRRRVSKQPAMAVELGNGS